MAALPTTDVFAFSSPKIKGEEIAVAFNWGAGNLHVLRASRSTWRGLFEFLAAEFAPPAPPTGEPARARRYPAGTRLRGPERDRVLAPLLARYEQGGLTEAAVAAQGGVSPSVFHMYRVQVLRARRAAAAAAAAPILKPGGKLL